MTSRYASDEPRGWTWTATVLIALVVALGICVILGWHIDSPQLARWVAGRKPMAYVSAISFVAIGAASLASTFGWRVLPSALTLFANAAGFSLGIDALLVKSTDAGPFPVRIAPQTAVCLLLLSDAVLSGAPSWLYQFRNHDQAVRLLSAGREPAASRTGFPRRKGR